MYERYHVEQWQNGPPPQGMKETFNHTHSRVRNAIERSHREVFWSIEDEMEDFIEDANFPEKNKLE